jgi:2-amino-4-hydroxy-6-hydroxymethyldihydropteridine diphosphokinase
MNKAYLLIGGNEGNRTGSLRDARERIATACGEILLQSAIYETAAWGKTNQPDFLNQALLVETGLGAPHLLETILDIEKQMGRTRIDKYGQRNIDIDILFFNHDILALQGLTVPHSQIQHRRFVLAPMNEIAPQFIHPVLKKTISALLSLCTDKLNVKKLSI